MPATLPMPDRSRALPCLLLLVLLAAGSGCGPSDEAGPGTLTPASDTTRATDAPPAPEPDPATRMTDGGVVRMPEAQQRALVAEDSLWAEALRIHYNAIVLDGHVDTPTLMRDQGYRLAARHAAAAAHVDLPRMAEGGLDAAFFSIYVAPPYGEGERAAGRARDLIAEVRAQVEAAPTAAEMAYTAADVFRIARTGRAAVLLGIEGGHALGASQDVLREMFDAGVRYVTLTHINTNSLADASQAAPRWGGLSDQGRAMVHAMNRIGMVVDLSHVSDSTFYDVLNVTTAPVLLSHSSARALVPNVRNVDDAMLRAVARNGGVVMINFFDAVVNPRLDADVWEEVRRRLPGPDLHTLWSVVYGVKRERGLAGASLDDVIDHIDHVARTAGVDHVGLGSDFDGVFDLPSGLQDVTRLPWITYGLLKRGYTEAALYKILGGNALRVLEAAQQAAQPRQPAPAGAPPAAP